MNNQTNILVTRSANSYPKSYNTYTLRYTLNYTKVHKQPFELHENHTVIRKLSSNNTTLHKLHSELHFGVTFRQPSSAVTNVTHQHFIKLQKYPQLHIYHLVERVLGNLLDRIRHFGKK